jgi:hypothetical protein
MWLQDAVDFWLEPANSLIPDDIKRDLPVPFDAAAAAQLGEQWTARRATLEAKLLQQFPDTNLNSRQQIGVALAPSRAPRAGRTGLADCSRRA